MRITKCEVVVLGNEMRCPLVMLGIFELVPHIAIHAQMMEEVVPLKDRVMFDHPVIRLGNEGLQDRRGHISMVEATQGVSNVVQESTNYVFIIFASLCSPLGGLEAMLKPVNWKATEIAFEELHVSQYSIRQAGHELLLLSEDNLPVFLGAFCERFEACFHWFPQIFAMRKTNTPSRDGNDADLPPNAAITGNITVSRFAQKIGRSPCAKQLTVILSASLPVISFLRLFLFEFH